MTVSALVELLRPSSENKPGDFVIMVHMRIDSNDEQKKHINENR